MTGLLLPPDASLTPRPDTQTLRPTLSVNKLAALLPTPDVTQTNSRNAGEAGNAVIQGRQTQGAGGALDGSGLVATTSTRETLSFAARTILDLLGKAADSAPRATATLMPAPPTPTTAAALPAALAGLVDHSGLFYESHLAAWVNGARTLTDVRKEPQASLGMPAQNGEPDQAPGRPVALLPAPVARPDAATNPATSPAAGAAANSPADLLAQALAARTAPLDPLSDAAPDRLAAHRVTSALTDAGPADHALPVPRSLAPGPHTGTGPAATPQQGALLYEAMARANDAPQPNARLPQQAYDSLNNPPASATPAGPAVHPGTEGLVRQQLELLATQQFRWAGEAWPGTHMAWEIARDRVGADDEAARGTQGAQTWSTRLLLELPELGTVEARLSLSPGGLGARLVAGASEVASRFDDARARLQERLAANGIELVQFTAGTGTPTRSQ
ncbi:flagellar hook-length control protein FliK [Cupriavidus lacunae]|uniref:Flagellar hook-length control protein FliK n=1 Tax=Cupriavidus lacunae TaxID=2666307 RepID=A0A370NN35_9BURK|nr:flagellar hook-length control protein FliK [Cupriavidus lacunae]RDK07020.1 flagellar hook-length control protein FliK [Cupriavidus lacunae]